MSRAIPHYIAVAESTGQPANIHQRNSKTDALRDARHIFRAGLFGAVVSVYEGKPTDNVERDPVKVWS